MAAVALHAGRRLGAALSGAGLRASGRLACLRHLSNDLQPPPGAPETHFGFRQVPEGDKARLVGEVFSRVADSYDLMNDLMSGGVHRLWKDHFVASAGPGAMHAACLRGPNPTPLRVLDVAGGTGDVAFRIVSDLAAAVKDRRGEAPRPEVTVFDINADMLRVGEQRATDRGLMGGGPVDVRFVCGDAQALPFPDGAFDLYTIAFGIRNVTKIPAALAEAHRVLRRGGRFLCLEFSRVPNPVLRRAYDAYSFRMIPALGEAVAKDRDSYAYLVESIRKFPPQEEFAAMIREAGFRHVGYTNLTAGVSAIHSGVKL